MGRRVALAGLIAFVGIVVVQHGLEPQLGPGRHTISEYVNTDAGALMTVGFAAWSLSLLATAAVVAGNPAGHSGRAARLVLAGLLAVASAGILLTACFATQTSAGVLPPGVRPTLAGHIHDLASGGATLALLGAVVASIVAFRCQARFRSIATATLAVALVSSVVLLAIGQSVNGIRQRVLLTAGCAWQAAVIALPARRAPVA